MLAHPEQVRTRRASRIPDAGLLRTKAARLYIWRMVNCEANQYTALTPLTPCNMDHQESSRFPAPFETPGATVGDARQIGEAIDAHWMRVVAALDPVIGQGGVAALFRYAVCQTALHYPWLAALLSDSDEMAGLHRLQEVFSAQSPKAASAAGSALFDAFGQTLVSLVGAPLGTRLLQPVQPGTSHRTSTADESR